MQIYVNGKLAVLKSGQSFEYVSENRLFSNSDAYTLTITFPLSGCPQNVDIFGRINRADVAAQKVRFDCELRDRNFYKYGTLTITGISQVEVKAQFLEGRSEQNFDKSFDKVYIDELDLGSANRDLRNILKNKPEDCWDPDKHNCQYVALPWVNDYSGNIQNLAECVVDDEAQNKFHYEWSKEKITGLSWQPYLLYITKKICEAIPGGAYSYDFTKWENDERYKYLLICNTLPFAWHMPEFARALPHWTVEEYFQKLELLLGAEFDFDHRQRRVNFDFTADRLAAKDVVAIGNVVEEYSSDVKAEEKKCDYQDAKNLVYSDCDHEMWKFYSCDWFVNNWPEDRILKYDTMIELFEDNKKYALWRGGHRDSIPNDKLLYAADCDSYFIFRPVTRRLVLTGALSGYFEYYCILQPVNLFGGRIVNDDEDAEKVEIEFVPAWIDQTEGKYGRLLFLSFSGYDEEDQLPEDEEAAEKFPFRQTLTVSTLTSGEKDKKAEYYDKIYIGWYDGSNYFRGTHLPYPNVDNVIIADDWSNFYFAHFSLRMNDKASSIGKIIHKIDPKVKTTFKFLSDTIPDVRAVFHIRGRRYLCEKITATFTDDGMSQLMKGEFYPIAD